MQPQRTGLGRALSNTESLVAELKTAKARIAALESKLASNKESLGRLLADDLRTCEELTELQKTIWGYHRALPGGCDCSVCGEVERSQRELEGLT